MSELMFGGDVAAIERNLDALGLKDEESELEFLLTEDEALAIAVEEVKAVRRGND